MEKIILDFEGEKVEYDALLSDYPLYSFPNQKFEFKGHLYKAVEYTTIGIEEQLEAAKKWNEDSGESFPNKMSLLIKMQMIK